MKEESANVCEVCGTTIPADGEFCLVCALRAALSQEGATGELANESAAAPQEVQFGHYELLTRDDGKPIELGRGAMGITYKAFDVDLWYPVALKVIGTQLWGGESAR
jgi:hypothetical protein